jgi:glyoxylase-like metal-dependent hydrolase (beta-lactamase superfamily II)
MVAAAEQLNPQVWRIPMAPVDFVNAFALLEDDGRVTLVDTGFKGRGERLLAALSAMGRGPSDVTRIVLTHAHGDHAGGAAEVVARTSAPVWAHETDAPWVEDGLAPPRDPALRTGRLLNRLGRRANGFPTVSVAERFADGAVLPVAGGLRVVHTPGHSPGHCALLREPTRTLITGDSIWNVRRMSWGVRAFCTDLVLNQRTAHALGELDYDLAAFTHGKPVRDGAREAVRGFLRDAAAG